MPRNYHLFNPGRLSRDNHTLLFEPLNGPKRYIPIADVSGLYVHGALDVNSAVLHFLGRAGIPIHFFDYHDHFTGSFQPREYLQAGQVLVAQVEHYTHADKRLDLARRFVQGAAHNIRRTLKYYATRSLPDISSTIDQVEAYAESTEHARDIPTLMGLEGNIRQTYYTCFDHICPRLPLNGRTRQPPQNEMNALVSYGNSLCYSVCLSELYHTQLDPTISFLHEPGVRRFSLALDLAEIFKPVLVDRVIFDLVNHARITPKDFEPGSGGILLKEAGRKKFIESWEERLKTTLEHKTLKRKITYRRLVRLEGYKLVKHLLEVESYRPYRANW